MGPKKLYLGSEVPEEELIWQDPIPALDYTLVNDQDIALLKNKILELTTQSMFSSTINLSKPR